MHLFQPFDTTAWFWVSLELYYCKYHIEFMAQGEIMRCASVVHYVRCDPEASGQFSLPNAEIY